MKKPLLGLGTVALMLACVAGAGPAQGAQAAQGPLRTVSTTKDIDGDGRADVVKLRKIDDRRCAVRVNTAAGATDVFVTRSDYNPCQWHGAARIDTRRGAELSVLTLMGAHTAFHTILAWRHGGLVKEAYPGFDGRWVVDGSVNFFAGLKRIKTDAGIRMVSTSVGANDGEHSSGTRAYLAFEDGRWVRKSRVAVRMNGDRAAAISGWHVRGLPRWAWS